MVRIHARPDILMLNGLRPGPKGCDENGLAAAWLVGHVSVQISFLLAPCRRPILIATKYLLFRGQILGCWRSSKVPPAIFSVALSYHSIDLYRCRWWKVLSTIGLACVVVGILLQAASVWIS